MVKSGSLIEVWKKAKILEFGVYGVLWVKVGFGGDCVEGVWLILRVEKAKSTILIKSLMVSVESGGLGDFLIEVVEKSLICDLDTI